MSPDPFRNLLLRAMDADDLARLTPDLAPVDMAEGALIAAAGAETDTVCFMETGVASYAAVAGDGTRIGVAMVGCEGLVEWHGLLDSPASTHEVTVAVGPASAYRLPAARLRHAAHASPALQSLLLRFVQSTMVQLSRTAASNLCDPVERRLCRWLLMNHDRLEGDEIRLTHQQVGQMLGVRRASVTDALHVLEGDGLIRCTRGSIVVRDRARLRQCAGDSYGVPEATYNRLIASFGKDR